MFLVLPCLRVSVLYTHPAVCCVLQHSQEPSPRRQQRIIWRRSRSDVSWCSVSLNVLWLSAEPCPFIAALAVEDRGGLQRRLTRLFEWDGGTFGWLPLSKTMSVRNKCLCHKLSIAYKLLCAPPLPPSWKNHREIYLYHNTPLPKWTVAYNMT